MKYFVSADVHGFYDEWITALNEKQFDINNPDHKIIVCGDLFDRGSQPKEVQSFVLDLTQKDKIILVKGNHEDLALELIENYANYIFRIRDTHHYSNGTFQTFLDLTGISHYEAVTCLLEFKRRASNTEYVKNIIPKMINYFETENYVFVHSWIPINFNDIDYDWRDATDEEWQKARWYKPLDMYKNGLIVPNKTLVFGHWRCSDFWKSLENKRDCHAPYITKDIIALDSTTVISKKVNVVVIED